MKLYLVKSAMPYFVSKQEEAKRDTRLLGCDWEQVEVPTADGREALAAFLNTLGGPASIQIVADEGNDDHVPVSIPDPSNVMKPIDRVDQSLSFEDGFEKMPLALKLHYASLAMEAARDELGTEQPAARRSWKEVRS